MPLMSKIAGRCSIVTSRCDWYRGTAATIDWNGGNHFLGVRRPYFLELIFTVRDLFIDDQFLWLSIKELNVSMYLVRKCVYFS